MEGRFLNTAVLVGVAMLALSCGGKKEPETAGRDGAEGEFKRCMDQEKYGDAKGCWHAFLDRFGSVASTAELAYAKERVDKEAAPASPANPEEDAVTRAARSMEGLVRLEERGGKSPAGDIPGGFPVQRVGFDECYKGFQVTGQSERDVVGLGERCGGPCGMVPFSGVMSGSQAENDDVDVYGIELRNDRCYRFFAVGEQSISDLDSAIADGDGNVLLRDVYTDSAPILGPEGPFCPPVAGHYKYVVSVAGGAGTFHFQVWQGPRGN
jgi:hypothetical protein